jgi:hypothetical protein
LSYSVLLASDFSGLQPKEKGLQVVNLQPL